MAPRGHGLGQNLGRVFRRGPERRGRFACISSGGERWRRVPWFASLGPHPVHAIHVILKDAVLAVPGLRCEWREVRVAIG